MAVFGKVKRLCLGLAVLVLLGGCESISAGGHGRIGTVHGSATVWLPVPHMYPQGDEVGT